VPLTSGSVLVSLPLSATTSPVPEPGQETSATKYYMRSM